MIVSNQSIKIRDKKIENNLAIGGLERGLIEGI